MVLTPKMMALGLFPRSIRRALVSRHFRREVEEWGEHELGQLGEFVGPGDLCIDIGCNVGSYAYQLSHLTGNVVAFEPNPHLARMVRGFGFAGVRVEAVALSSRDGVAELVFPTTHGGHALGTLKGALHKNREIHALAVPVRTLDSYGFKDVKFIKIDVEGFEEEVLQGASETIRCDRPTLLIEIEERHNPGAIGRIAARLGELGYRGVFNANDARRTIGDLDHLANEGALEALGQVRTRRSVTYINNFFFLPS